MTTIPVTRQAMQTTARPGASGASGPIAASVIDPLKLAKKHKWLLIGAAVAGLVAGVVGHVLLMQFYPVYSPSMAWECFPQERDVGMRTNVMNDQEELDKFKATQVQYMTADGVIDAAVNDPSLQREAPDFYRTFVRGGHYQPGLAARRLKSRLRVGVVGESNWIRMSFWWNTKEDPTAILKVVARAYERQRSFTANNQSLDRKDALLRSIREFDKQVEAKQAERARLLEDQNVESLDERVNAATRDVMTHQEVLMRVRTDMQAVAVRIAELQAELNSPVGVTFPDELRQAAEQEPLVLNLKHQINSLEAHRIGMLERGIGASHMSLHRIDTQLNGLRHQLADTRERTLRQLFDGRLGGMRTMFLQLQAQEADLLGKIEEKSRRAAELTRVMARVEDLRRDIGNLQVNKANANDDLANLQSLGELRTSARIVVAQDAQIPRSVSFPKIYIMVPLGIMIVLGLVAGAIVLVETLDQRVKGPACIAMIAKTRVAGLIPHASEDPSNPQKVETVFRDQPSGVMAESYRQVRGWLLKRMQQSGHKTLLVVGGMPGSGATSAATNLAYSLASAEQRVLLIDANFRRPSIHRALGLSESPGLADVLVHESTLAQASVKTDEPGLTVLPAGTAQNRRFERLATEAMTKLLSEAAGQFDVVIVDAAPAVVAGDAVSLANRCDATLLVVRAMGETRGMVARLRNDLAETRSEFLGVLVNAVRSAAGGYLKGNIRATHKYQTAKE